MTSIQEWLDGKLDEAPELTAEQVEKLRAIGPVPATGSRELIALYYGVKIELAEMLAELRHDVQNGNGHKNGNGNDAA